MSSMAKVLAIIDPDSSLVALTLTSARMAEVAVETLLTFTSAADTLKTAATDSLFSAVDMDGQIEVNGTQT